jgi:ABC-type nitrate/sulfonate/bicarbonate transport system permease component
MQLAGGLRNVIGLSWAFSLGAEYVSADKGLGYITYQCYSYSEMGQLIILAVVYAGLGYGSYELARFLISRLTPWHRKVEEELT